MSVFFLLHSVYKFNVFGFESLCVHFALFRCRVNITLKYVNCIGKMKPTEKYPQKIFSVFFFLFTSLVLFSVYSLFSISTHTVHITSKAFAFGAFIVRFHFERIYSFSSVHFLLLLQLYSKLRILLETATRCLWNRVHTGDILYRMLDMRNILRLKCYYLRWGGFYIQQKLKKKKTSNNNSQTLSECCIALYDPIFFYAALLSFKALFHLNKMETVLCIDMPNVVYNFFFVFMPYIK